MCRNYDKIKLKVLQKNADVIIRTIWIKYTLVTPKNKTKNWRKISHVNIVPKQLLARDFPPSLLLPKERFRFLTGTFGRTLTCAAAATVTQNFMGKR